LKRKFRLTRSKDITRVRQRGKSYAHEIVVLIACPNDGTQSRVGILTARGIRKAVQRNRSKRLIREVARSYFPLLKPGWDIVIIARQSIVNATYHDLTSAVGALLREAGLIHE